MTFNPDNEDMPDEAGAVEDADTDAERDEWSEWRARQHARYERTRPRGQAGNPWEWINESERELARAVEVHIRRNPDATAAGIAALLGCREHEARHARWVLAASGMVHLTRGKWRIREAVPTA